MSPALMASRIQKLSLARGDVVVVKDYETLKFLAEMPIHLDFVVPLVFAPQGIEKLTRQDLLNLLEQADQVVASPVLSDSTVAPL
jgi:hypothetical protein